MPWNGLRGLIDKQANFPRGCQLTYADLGLVETQANSLEGMHINPLGKTRLLGQQPVELGLEGGRQRIGEGGQQYAGIGMLTREVRSTVQGHDGLAGTGRT